VVLRGDAFEPGCSVRVVLDRIGDKWTVLVVSVLADRTLRFGELRERIGGVAPKVLTQTLRALERDGVLSRKAYAEVPPRVEYSLTDLGRSLAEPIAAIQDWAEGHVATVLAARQRYDGVEVSARTRSSARR
jgi:DNA-binding HxlR family transcriptional regulator